jgi:hypothetical protein
MSRKKYRMGTIRKRELNIGREIHPSKYFISNRLI